MHKINPNDYENAHDYYYALRNEYMKTSFFLMSQSDDVEALRKINCRLKENDTMKALSMGNKYEMYADTTLCFVGGDYTIKTVFVDNFSKASMKAAYDEKPAERLLKAWTPGVFIFNATDRIDDILDVIDMCREENGLIAITLNATHWETKAANAGAAQNLDGFLALHFR